MKYELDKQWKKLIKLKVGSLKVLIKIDKPLEKWENKFLISESKRDYHYRSYRHWKGNKTTIWTI